MNEIQQDLRAHRTYLWIVLGIFLGIAAVMMTMRFITPKNALYGGNANGLVSPANNLPGSSKAGDISPSYAKALENPDKPYTDENGVVHPPVGAAPVAVDPNVKVEHPPVGGTGKTPVAPVAPVAPKPVAPVAPKTTPIAPVVPSTN
jgi:hypothetical protein